MAERDRKQHEAVESLARALITEGQSCGKPFAGATARRRRRYGAAPVRRSTTASRICTPRCSNKRRATAVATATTSTRRIVRRRRPPRRCPAQRPERGKALNSPLEEPHPVLRRAQHERIPTPIFKRPLPLTLSPSKGLRVFQRAATPRRRVHAASCCLHSGPHSMIRLASMPGISHDDAMGLNRLVFRVHAIQRMFQRGIRADFVPTMCAKR